MFIQDFAAIYSKNWIWCLYKSVGRNILFQIVQNSQGSIGSWTAFIQGSNYFFGGARYMIMRCHRIYSTTFGIPKLDLY